MNRASWPWAGIAAGLALIAAWYAATRTTLLIAYGSPAAGTRTLAQVQGICDSSFGTFARTMSAQGAAGCGHIDSLSTSWNAAGFAGLLLAAAAGIVLIYRAQRPRGDTASRA